MLRTITKTSGVTRSLPRVHYNAGSLRYISERNQTRPEDGKELPYDSQAPASSLKQDTGPGLSIGKVFLFLVTYQIFKTLIETYQTSAGSSASASSRDDLASGKAKDPAKRIHYAGRRENSETGPRGYGTPADHEMQ